MARKTKKIKGEEYDDIIASRLYELEDILYSEVSKKLSLASKKILAWSENNNKINKSIKEDLTELLSDEDFFIDLAKLLPIIKIGIDFQLKKIQERGINLDTVGEALGIDWNIEPPFIDFIGKREKYLQKTLKQTTIDRINEVIKSGLKDGLPYQEIAKQIELSTSLNGYRAELIARTETNWAFNEGQRRYVKELGVKQYQISVAPTGCALCQSKANQIFSVNEKNVLPVHPACRCVLISVIPQEWLSEMNVEKAFNKINPLLLSKSEITEEILKNKKIVNILNYPKPKDGQSGKDGKDAVVENQDDNFN